MKFLASDLGLDIRDEVLDVFDGLTLLGNLLEVVGRRVISHEKIVKFGVAHVKNLDEGAELVNLRHTDRLSYTPTLASLRRRRRLKFSCGSSARPSVPCTVHQGSAERSRTGSPGS